MRTFKSLSIMQVIHVGFLECGGHTSTLKSTTEEIRSSHCGFSGYLINIVHLTRAESYDDVSWNEDLNQWLDAGSSATENDAQERILCIDYAFLSAEVAASTFADRLMLAHDCDGNITEPLGGGIDWKDIVVRFLVVVILLLHSFSRSFVSVA